LRRYVRSRTESAQMNEVLCKVLCHNICVKVHSIYELGIVPEFFTTQPAAAEKATVAQERPVMA
jgi:hypothetical protein